MLAQPIQEMEKLHQKKLTAKPQELVADSPVSLNVSGELFDIRAIFEVGDTRQVGLDIGGNKIVYDTKNQQLNGAPLKPQAGRVSMRVLVDRPLLEICGNEGSIFITAPRTIKGDVQTVKAFAEGPGARLISLEVHELKSIWK